MLNLIKKISCTEEHRSLNERSTDKLQVEICRRSNLEKLLLLLFCKISNIKEEFQHEIIFFGRDSIEYVCGPESPISNYLTTK